MSTSRNAHPVRAEIVATVWKLLCVEGQAVRGGDVLAILESMKMEIPVYASMSGRVSHILVTEGQSVQENDALVTIASH